MSSVGVYVHVPFCERVCPYCDFAVVAAHPLRSADEGRYVDALLTEIARRSGSYFDASLASIYLGGGTPSLLQPESVRRILDAIEATFPWGEELGRREVTLEVNPSTVEAARLPEFRAAGVNRLSVGVQSFDDEVLRRLGRAHRAPVARETLAAVREASFTNVSIDLIFGAPGGSASQLARDLRELTSFAPEHVSTYELTVEAGTPFALADARGQLSRPGEEELAAALATIERALADIGVQRYEISNHARPGFESQHNRRYWRREPVLGVGVGAASSLPRSSEMPHGGRATNVRSLSDYLQGVESSGVAVGDWEEHDAATARLEAVFLGLRQTAGLSAERFAAEFGASLRGFFSEEVDALCAEGLLVESHAGDLRLSEKGRLFADSVAARFVS